jgi:O-antigen/teichoic acid export membrane protein
MWIVATYALAPYRPRFSLASWRGFAHFMSWTTGAQLLSAFNWQCDRLLLGRFVARAELGSFSLANDLSFIPEQALIKPIVRPLISVFALIRDDRERIAAAYLTTASCVLAFGTPVLLGLSLLADPAVRLALGGKWVAAIPILQWLSLTLIPPLFTSPFSALALATGRPREVLHQAGLEAMNKLPLMLLGASLYGVAGAIAARAGSSIITALIVLVLVKRLLGTPIVRQLAVTWRTIGGGMMLAMVLLALRPILHGKAGLELGGLLAGVSLIGAVSYAITLAALWHLSGRPAGLERTIFDRFVAPTVWRLSPAKH